MARAQFRWESLPEDLRDINAFQPIIAQVMLPRFPSSQGYLHEAIGKSEYRVRRGLFGGWDVRVWRQENLNIDVSPGSRFGSVLPVVAGLLALAGLGVLDHYGYRFGPSKGSGYIMIASWTVMFLVFWGLLGLLIRPVVGAIRRDPLDQDLLDEIRRALPDPVSHAP